MSLYAMAAALMGSASLPATDLPVVIKPAKNRSSAASGAMMPQTKGKRHASLRSRSNRRKARHA